MNFLSAGNLRGLVTSQAPKTPSAENQCIYLSLKQPLDDDDDHYDDNDHHVLQLFLKFFCSILLGKYKKIHAKTKTKKKRNRKSCIKYMYI